MMDEKKNNLRRIIAIYIITFLLLFKDVILPLQNSELQGVILLLTLSAFYQKNKLNLCILWYGLFLIITAISMLYYGRDNAVLTLANTFLYILSYTMLCNDFTCINHVFRSFCVWGSLLFGFLLISYYSVLGYGRLGDIMYETTYGSSIQFSYYIMTILLSSIIVFIQDRYNKLFLTFSILCIILGFTISLFNGAKKGYLIPFFFIFFYNLISLRYNFIKRLFRIFVLVIVFVFLWDYLKSIDLLQRYFVNRVESMIAYFTIGEAADADTSTSSRMSYIPIALNAFFDSPFWGMGGLGYSPQYFMKMIHVTHPHNNYLNLLASGGLFLFFAFYWFPFKLLVNTYSLLRENKKRREVILLLSLIISSRNTIGIILRSAINIIEGFKPGSSDISSDKVIL